MAGEEGWSLTPEGREFGRQNIDLLKEMLGWGEVVEGLRTKFNTQEWILVEDEKSVEVWSILDNEVVTVLTGDSRAYDKDGNLLGPDEAILEWLALKFTSARDGKDEELTSEGRNLKKWIKTLPIEQSVIDGSCVDNFLQKYNSNRNNE